VSAQPKPAEISAGLEGAKNANLVIVATSDIAKNRAQADLVNTLLRANVPTIVVATRSPYDLLYVKDTPTYLTIYSANPPMLEALAAVLTGKAKAQGKLPIDFRSLRDFGSLK